MTEPRFAAEFAAEIAAAQQLIERLERGVLEAEDPRSIAAFVGELLEQERRRFRNLFDAASGAYLVTNAVGMVVQASDEAYTLVGRTEPSMLIGRPMSMLLQPGDRPGFARILDRIASNGGPVNWETTVIVPGRPPLPIVAHGMPADPREQFEVRWLLIPNNPEIVDAHRLRRRGLVHEVVDAIRAGAYVTDASGTCVFANREAGEILGRSIIGEVIEDWPDGGFDVGSEAGPFGRFRIERPDGSFSWIAHGTRELTHQDGTRFGVVGTIADVTQIVTAEKAAIASGERLEGILATASDAVITTDEDLRVIVFNDAAEQTLGYDADDVIGRPLSDILPASVAAHHASWMQEFGGQARPRQQMGAGRYVMAARQDGTEFPAEVSISAGSVAGRTVYVAILRDVTAKAAATQELERAEQRFRAVFDQALVGIAVTDLDQRVLEVNDALCSSLDLCPTELQHASFADLLESSSRERNQQWLDRSLREQQPGFRLADQQFIRRDGASMWANVAISIVRDPNLEPRFLVYIVEDVTGRRELETQLHQSQQIELAAQLGSGLAHDLNNVLAVLRGHLDLLEDDIPATERTSRRLASVHLAMDRASAVATGLLTLGRRPEYAPKVFDLNELVSTVAVLTRELLGDAIQLRVDTQAIDATVKADAQQLEQAVLSMVVNARDAMPTGGTLTLRTRTVDADPAGFVGRSRPDLARIALDISDTGVGMDAGTEAQVFTPYFTTKPPGSGTGLGLSQALQVVRQARGTIDVRSTPGAGTTFTIALPLIDLATVEHAVASSGTDTLGVAVGTILVVDDDRDVLEVVAETLERAGHDVLQASGAAEAEGTFEVNTHIDLVITDMVMPEESGLSLAARLRRKRPWVSVLMMSAHFDETIDGRTIGPSIDKPFSAATLLQAVQTLLTHSDPIDLTTPSDVNAPPAR